MKRSIMEKAIVQMKKINIKTVIGIVILLLFAGVICIFGYRVIVTSDELPGRLMSIRTAVTNTQYMGYTMKQAQKPDYSMMKYGYMDQLLLAQMNQIDRHYEEEQMAAIRALNDLTAMSQKTADKLAYEQAKAAQDKAAQEAKMAALAAEQAKNQRIKELAQQIKNEVEGVPEEDNAPIDVGDDKDTGSGSTKSNGGKKGEPVYANGHGKSLGKFVITAYCTCKICCGVYSGRNRTASGTVPTTNRTLAVDTNVIPFGTRLVIDGQIYVAEDRGGAIKGKRIDMFFYTHKEALRWGRRTKEVFLAD